MSITLKDALAECRRIRMDLTNAQAKLTDVIEALAAHPDADRDKPRCPHCDTTYRSRIVLAEHVHRSHDGPIPDHWLAADRAAGIL